MSSSIENLHTLADRTQVWMVWFEMSSSSAGLTHREYNTVLNIGKLLAGDNDWATVYLWKEVQEALTKLSKKK